jgi:hypothetical protein
MATQDDERTGYTGLHAFVFMGGLDAGRNIADVIDAIGGPDGKTFPNGQVLFASVLVGAYVGFAHLRTDEGDLAALQRLIHQDLWDKGVRGEHAIEGAVYMPPNRISGQPMGPKRGSPPVCALVRVRVAGDPVEVMNEIGNRFDSSDPFRGASVTFGTADLLVELAGDGIDAVGSPVLRTIRWIRGVVSTETSFAFTEPWRTPS